MEILVNAIIKAAGWSILHSLWQGAILYSILLLLFISNPKLSAKSRHNLSFLTLTGMFLWFIMTFYNEFTEWLYIGRSIGTISAYSSGTTTVHYSIVELPASLIYKAEQSIPLIVSIYGIGLILQIIWLACGYYRVWQIKTKGLSDLPSDLNERFINIISKVQLKRKIRFKLSSRVSVPMVMGYFKPLVLLPLSILAQMNQEQLEAIIIHELSHIRRNDYLLNILKISVETVLFFNPFVWLSSKIIDTERENACDDLVLKITGSPLSYAKTLLQLERIKSGQQVFTVAITGKKYYLLNRIKRITNMKTNNLNLKWQLFAILMAVTVVLSLAWIPAKKTVSSHFDRIKQEAVSSVSLSKIQEYLKSGSQKNELNKLSEDAVMDYVESKRMNNKDDNNTLSDTLPKPKGKFKIILEDENGNKKEYNSLNELPAELRSAFLKQNRMGYAMPFDIITSPNVFKMDSAGLSKFSYDFKMSKDQYDSDLKFYKEGATTIEGKPITRLRVNGKDIYGPDSIKTILTDPSLAKSVFGLTQPIIRFSEDLNILYNNQGSKPQEEAILKKMADLRKQLEGLEFRKQQEEVLKQTEKMRNLSVEERNKIIEEMNKKIETGLKQIENQPKNKTPENPAKK